MFSKRALQFLNIDWFRKLSRFAKKPNLIIFIITAVLACTGFAYAQSNSDITGPATNQTAVNKHKAGSKDKANPMPTDESAVNTTEKVDDPTPSEPESTTSEATAKPVPTKATAPAPIPTPAPTPAVIDTVLSSSSVTIPIGGTSATMQATSATGEPLEWAVLVGGGVFAQTGLVSNGRTTAHNFSFFANPNFAKPGVYQADVMGYIPGGQKVIKKVTITVVGAQ